MARRGEVGARGRPFRQRQTTGLSGSSSTRACTARDDGADANSGCAHRSSRAVDLRQREQVERVARDVGLVRRTTWRGLVNSWWAAGGRRPTARTGCSRRCRARTRRLGRRWRVAGGRRSGREGGPRRTRILERGA
ncbi:hypothetical protein VPH35_138144 [Triticum aestivum]|uniref:Uncharacterized protein n=1 Tax=Aegilops tauschii subsp. strangulata TaxID=200361 RepID=A0A453S7S2_AEGTS